MIGTTLAGITFINFNDLDIQSGDEVEVSIDDSFQDDETAYVVKHKGITPIGYIPKLMTISQWGIEARSRGDLDSYNYNRDRYIATKIIRDNIFSDMNRNHIPVIPAWISRIVRDEDDTVKSVGVAFDYM
jgi:hypothetical protein|tara:strand:- start:113 stop:502 length:390 start_codon:yes stop_codon:yes gene_type:complete